LQIKRPKLIQEARQEFGFVVGKIACRFLFECPQVVDHSMGLSRLSGQAFGSNQQEFCLSGKHCYEFEEQLGRLTAMLRRRGRRPGPRRRFGGLGYDVDRRPDLSNVQWALEALWLTDQIRFETAADQSRKLEKAAPDLHWENAIKFLERCQNLRKSNDQPWAGNDGGFIYRPGESMAGGTTSYGGMTYAGLKSFIYARVSRTDPRVQAAFNWIRKHYTLDENPGIGLQGLYYYYHTMAKALDAYGAEVIVDAQGKGHKWRGELLARLVSLQKGDGYWVNENARWWENDKVLVTSYTVLAMEMASSVYR